MNVKPASFWANIGALTTGVVPRVGTLFIGFATGDIYETSLLQGSARQMREVELEIQRYNAMAKVAWDVRREGLKNQ